MFRSLDFRKSDLVLKLGDSDCITACRRPSGVENSDSRNSTPRKSYMVQGACRHPGFRNSGLANSDFRHPYPTNPKLRNHDSRSSDLRNSRIEETMDWKLS